KIVRLYADPCRLAPPRVERHDRQGQTSRPVAGAGEPDDGGADEGYLRYVVTAADIYRAIPLAHPHLHGGDHHPLGAEPPDVPFQLEPGVVPGPDRDTQDKPGGYPALRDQLGEILTGHIGGKRCPLPVRGARRADRGADGRELQPAEGKRSPRQPDAHHPMPAKLGALGGHPADGRVAGLVHGLHKRTERPGTVPPGYLGRRPGRHLLTGGPPNSRAAIPAGGPSAVDGRAEHLPDGLEAHAADSRELIRRQRRAPRVSGPASRDPGLSYGGHFVAHAPSLGLLPAIRLAPRTAAPGKLGLSS